MSRTQSDPPTREDWKALHEDPDGKELGYDRQKHRVERVDVDEESVLDPERQNVGFKKYSHRDPWIIADPKWVIELPHGADLRERSPLEDD